MYAPAEPELVDPSHLEELSDSALIKMVKSGSDVALGVLLRRHRDALYRFCLHLTHNRDDAEDVCQESMARAITRVDSLQLGSAFRSWLFSIARNLSIDSHRSRARLCALPDEETGPLPLPLHHESPYDQVEVREEYQTVAQALARLKKNHQTVLMLREVEGLSYAEIAARLDLSQAAVETLLFRARKRLREEYTRTGAPTPVVAVLGALRGLLSRLAAPFGGAPLAAKLAASALLIGGAAVATPRLVPVLHAAAGGSPSASAHVAGLPSTHTTSSTASAPVTAVAGTGQTSTHQTATHASGTSAASNGAVSRTVTRDRGSAGHFQRISGHVSGSTVAGRHSSTGSASPAHGASGGASGGNSSASTGTSKATVAHGQLHGSSSKSGGSAVAAPATSGAGVNGGATSKSGASSGALAGGSGKSGSGKASGTTGGSHSSGSSGGGSTTPPSGSGATGTVSGTAAGAQQAASGAAGAAQQAASSASGTAQQAVSGATNAAQQAANSAQQAASSAVSGVQQAASGATSNAAGAAQQAASGAASAAQNTASGAANTAGKAGSAAVATVTKTVGNTPAAPKSPGKGPTPTVPPVPVPTITVPKIPKP